MIKLSVLIVSLLFSISSNAHISVDKIKQIRSDKKVVNLRSGQYLYTLTPSSLFTDDEIKYETLQQFQSFATSLTKNWHTEIAKILQPQLSKYSPSELEKLSFEEFNKKLESGEISLNSYEIIQGVHENNDPKKATKDMNKVNNDLDKFLKEYNYLIESLSEESELYGEFSGQPWYKRMVNHLWQEKFPDAFIIKGGGKFSDGLTAKMKNSRHPAIRFLAPLTLGGVHFSYIGKYWRVLETNLNTGKSKVFYYKESGFQIWYTKDLFEGGLQKISKNFRLGYGFLWGNADRVEDYSGYYAGVSKSFARCPVSSLLTFVKIPFVNRLPNCNVKAGVIGPSTIDIFNNNPEITSVYVIASLEGGVSPSATTNKAHLNIGSMTQFYDLKEVYTAFTSDELTKEALNRDIPEGESSEDKTDSSIGETDRVMRPNKAVEEK